jgi:glucose/arabinose dehydrogenase
MFWLGLFFACLATFASDFQAVRVGSGFIAPTNIASSRDGSGRLFITEHGGTIRVLNPGSAEPAPFLDITERVWQREGFCCDERGLLGITFPPGNDPKDHFFASYVDRESNVVVSRFAISPESGLGDPSSEIVLQKLMHKDENHFGGAIAFSPVDGLLYWSIGDGSAAFNVVQSQDPRHPFGKVLRFDAYADPQNRHLEIYLLGLRNPWRFSFDPATGDLYVGDVGENAFEEINYVPAGSSAGSLNFGWGIMEGLECWEFGSCSKEGLALPIVVFDHDAGCSATGGETYRGARHPEWDGKYFYADFCQGNIWETHRDENGQWLVNKVLDRSDNAISTFGVAEDGEIYFANYITGDILLLDSVATIEPEASRRRRK